MTHPSRSRFEPITAACIVRHPVWERLDARTRRAIQVVSAVLPFRTNSHVVDRLIDWSAVPDDPRFRLNFPQPEMLDPEAYAAVARALDGGDRDRLAAVVGVVRESLNPHPAGPLDRNVPLLDGRPLPGAQHEYPETLLWFPAAGQTCHADCTFCFRRPQFVGEPSMRFGAKDHESLVGYLALHREVTDVLLTGGDPMVMATRTLARSVDPLLEDARLDHVQTIRIGTKPLADRPQRFVTDPDADDLLGLFRRVIAGGLARPAR